MQSFRVVTEFQLEEENSSIWEWHNAFVPPMESTKEEEGGGVDMATSVGLGFVLTIFIILTITGNAMVLHAVRTDRKLQTVCNMFIVSLAIADLIVGLVVMPISAIYIFTDDWVFGVGLCQFWIGVDYTASTASILNLFVLSLDRYWSVTNPLKYMRKRTRGRGYVMISMVWVVSCLWIVPIVGWHHFVNAGDRVVPSNVCDTEYATNTSLKIITSILNFYLPLAVMYALYTKIFLEIRHRSKLEVGQRVHFTGARGVSMETLPRDSDDASYIDYLQINDLTGRKSESLGSTRRFACLRLRETFRLPTSGGTTPNPGFVEMTDKRRPQTCNDDALGTTCAARSPEVQAPPVDHGANTDANGSRDPSFLRADEASHVKRKMKRLDSGVCLGLGIPNVQCKVNGAHSRKKSKANETAFSRSVFREISGWRRRDDADQKEPVDSPATYGRNYVLPEEDYLATPDLKYQSLPVLYKNEHPVSPSRSQPEDASCDLTGVRFSVGGGEPSSGSSSDDADENKRETRFPQEMHPSKNHVIRRLASQNSDRRPLPAVVLYPLNPVEGHVSRRHLGVGKRSSSHDQQRHLESGLVGVRRSHSGVVVGSRSPGKRTRRRRPVHGTSSALQKEIKAARQLGVIMGAFTVCFLPYFVCFTVVAFCDWCVGGQLMTAVTWIGYLNSAMNPFLYPLCNVSFRRKFRQMLNVVVMRENLRKLCAHWCPPIRRRSSLCRHSNLSTDPN